MSGVDAKLNNLPVTAFREIVGLLEQVRQQSDAQTMLEGIRPRLARLRLQRKPTLQRLFYQPVEDLLTGVATPDGDIRVSRVLMHGLWNELQCGADTTSLAELAAALRRAGADDVTEQHVIARRLWCWAAASLAAGPANDADHRARETVIDCLRAGAAILALQLLLPPKPSPPLSEKPWAEIQPLIVDAAGGDPGLTGVLLLTTMGRMVDRAEFFHRAQALKLGLSEDAERLVFDRLTRAVIGNLLTQAESLDASAPDNRRQQALEAQRLVNDLKVAEDALATNPRACKEIGRLRQAARGAVSGLIEGAALQVTEGLSVGASACIADQITTENNVLAIRKCKQFGAALGLEPAIDEQIEAIVGTLRQRARQLEPAASASQPALQRRQLFWLVRMLELSGNLDEADRLRRAHTEPGKRSR